jgi:hypothetical protein
MAKQEQDREDLLREGKQMSLRAEASIDGVVVVIGFRSQGQASFYFGADPVFQFNAALELRRVFHQGKRYAAIQGRLCELVRKNQRDRVSFESQDILADVEAVIMRLLDSSLARIRVALETPMEGWEIAGGQEADFRNRLTDWMTNIPVSVVIADTPNA